MIEPKISGQPDQVNQTGSKLGQNLKPCLASNVFAKGVFCFCLSVCLTDIFRFILTVLVLKKRFLLNMTLQKKPKNWIL
jgi:hypothetical protein